MAENGSDIQQQPFYEKLTKTLTFVSIIGLVGVDLVLLVIAVVLFPVLIILSPLLIILIPVFVIFSPVLIILASIILSPWFITLVLVIIWIYNYVTGKNPFGADQVDKAREKIAEAAKEVKNKVEQLWEKVTNLGNDIAN